jgi:hypothetical protein
MDAMVKWNGGAWMVKEKEFFDSQINDDGNNEWKKAWRPIYGVDGIEHARDRARLKWGQHGERWSEV